MHEHIGQKIKSEVIPKGMSQEAAAKKLAVTRQTLSRVVNGHTKLSEELATKIEIVFGYSADELLNEQRATELASTDAKAIGVRSYTTVFYKITADDIETYFSRKKVSRDELAALIRILIQCDNSSLEHCTFPAHDNAERKGWDGETRAKDASTYVPEGSSIWELGTNSIPQKKAEADYTKSREKKNKLPDQICRKTTFVFVTPRNWEKGKDWAIGKDALGDYKAVRVIDACLLEQWVERYPQAQIWLAEKIGIPTEGVMSLSEYWTRWAAATEPELSPVLFKKSIEGSTAALKTWFDKKSPNVFSIQGTTREEVGAFLGAAACICDELAALLQNCLVVTKDTPLSRLAASNPNLIPLAIDPAAAQQCIRVFRDRPVILARDNSMVGNGGAHLPIDLPDTESFREGLKAMGFNKARIEQLESSTHRSPIVLRRLLAKIHEDRQPPWAKQLSDPRKAIPIFLAGTWQSRKEDDRAFLEGLAEICGMSSYDDIEATLAQLSTIEDAPFWRESDYRGVNSKLECLYVLGPHITESILDAFFDWAAMVLSEMDPALDLEPEQRWAAAIFKKTRKSSNALRKSVAETLGLLAVHGEAHIKASPTLMLQSYVNRLVDELLSKRSADNWLSQNDLLRSYAEASPEAFLRAVSRELRDKEPVLDVIFQPANLGILGSSSYRVEILWALELLAWSPDYVYEACSILAELCCYSCDDNLTSKPLNSLKDILLAWRPHTSLPVDKRIALLKMLAKKFPEIGWELAVHTLESGSHTTSGTCRPKWRDFACGASDVLTWGEIWEYAAACREIVLSHSNYSLAKLKSLLRCAHNFPQDEQECFFSLFTKWRDSSASKSDIIHLREAVRTSTRTRRAVKQRKQRNSDNSKTIDSSQLFELLEPSSTIDRHAWLFLRRHVEESADELDENEFDFQAREERIAEAREEAMQEIWTERGISGVFELLEYSEDGWIVGWTLGGLKFSIGESAGIISELYLAGHRNKLQQARYAASGILYKLQKKRPQIVQLVQKCSTSKEPNLDLADFCTLMPFDHHTVSIVDSLGEQTSNRYWEVINPGFFRDDDIDPDIVIDRLLKANRPIPALNVAQYSFKKLDTSIILELLTAAAQFDGPADRTYKIDPHWICEIFEEIEVRQDAPDFEIAKLELAFVEILAAHHEQASIPALSRILARDPRLFFQMLASVYLRGDRKDDSKDLDLPSDPKLLEDFSSKARSTLESASFIPGMAEATIDEQVKAGTAWIREVLEWGEQFDRKYSAANEIGELLARCEAGRDEIWPNELVRCLLDEFSDPDMATGFSIAKRNQRGATWRPLPESGAPERKLAENYRLQADKLVDTYPFTAKVLRDIAMSYENDAKLYDRDGRLSQRMSY